MLIDYDGSQRTPLNLASYHTIIQVLAHNRVVATLRCPGPNACYADKRCSWPYPLSHLLKSTLKADGVSPVWWERFPRQEPPNGTEM